MTGAVAAHYAHALADAVFAAYPGLAAKDAVEQLTMAEGLMSGSKDLQKVLRSPAVPKARKQAVVASIADALGLHRLLKNFLLVLVNHRRAPELRAIRREFELQVDERLGAIQAEITSAHELTYEQRGQVEVALANKLGKYIRATYRVDPGVLAGIRARVASKEYDATLRGKLDQLRHDLFAPV